jgi:AcrR family transcriptional regulator
MARNPQVKIDRIVTAAVAEFARAGRDGARVDAIADEAGMNKRLLYHYLGDKDALFDAAIDRCVAVLKDAGSKLDRVEATVWRVLCHAEAANRAPDFEALHLAVARPGEPGQLAIDRLATVVLGALLPTLAAALESLEVGPAGDRDSDRVGVRHQKPRVKLKPDLKEVPGRDR